VRDREKLVTVGITQIAADRLGPIGFVELPYPGDILKEGQILCQVRGDGSPMVLRMPFTGKMMNVNPLLVDQPGLINSDPYGKGWIVKMEPGDPALIDAKVEGVMDPPFPLVDVAEEVERVVPALLANNSAVLVEEAGQPIGLITRSDLLEFVAHGRR